MSQSSSPITLTIERLWQFCLQRYGVPGMKTVCLALQDQYSGNVNLLLLLNWLDEQQLTFDSHLWDDILSRLYTTERLLKNFRKLRRESKAYIPKSLYHDHLELELQLEKQQQSDLVEWVNAQTLRKAEKADLLFCYFKLLGADKLYKRLP